MPKFNTKLSRREKRYLQTLKRLLFVRYRNISKLAIPLVVVAFIAYIISALFITDDKAHNLVKDLILAVAGGLTLALVYWRAKNDSQKLDLEIEKADNDRIKLNQEIGKNIKDRFNDAIKNLSDKDNVGIRIHGVRMLIDFIKEAYKDDGTDKYENNLYKGYGKNSFDILIYHLQKLSKEHGEAFEKHQVDVVLKNMNEQFKDEIDKPFELTDIPLFEKYTKNKNKFIETYREQTQLFSMSIEMQEVINLLFDNKQMQNIRQTIKEEYKLKYYPNLYRIHLEGIRTTTPLYLDNINFNSANFTCSNFNETTFENSNLYYTNFTGCHLYQCNFVNITLLYAKFIVSDLHGINFNKSILYENNFYYSRLSRISNFEIENLRNNNKFENVNITRIINNELKEGGNKNDISEVLTITREALSSGAYFTSIKISSLVKQDYKIYIHSNRLNGDKYEVNISTLATSQLAVEQGKNTDYIASLEEDFKEVEEILYKTGFYTAEMKRNGKINDKDFKYD